MKVLIAGDWHSELHEEAMFQAFSALGHQVFRFAWYRYFQPSADWPVPLGVAARVSMKFQNKYLFGPTVNRLNRDLVRMAAEVRPDIVFVYRGTHVTPHTLTAIKEMLPDALLAGYNNDDPFGPGQPHMLWRHFLRCLPHYDLTLAYRPHNVAEFQSRGARAVHLLRSGFMPERNHPVTLTDADRARYASDVVFVGHYENDGRIEYLEEVVRQGYTLRLFGPGYDWDSVIARSRWLKRQRPVQLVWGEEYNKALCGAKIALCFFSRLNRDTYTRRCFEIPAAGTMMLSEYSDDAATLFAAGREADFFRDKQEFIAKLKLYLDDDALRSSIAAAGLKRVWADGHDVTSRMRQLLQHVAVIKSRRKAIHA